MSLDSVQSIINENSVDRPRQVAQKQLTKDDFVKLFLTQLTKQNPLKPFDTGAMMQNMSQMTQLGSTEELNKTIKTLDTNMARSSLLQSTQMIGKKVAAPSDLNHLSDKGMTGSILLESPASEVIVTIRDKDNKEIKKVHIEGTSSSGVVDYAWDGKNEAGEVMKPGFYNISVDAKQQGTPVKAYAAGHFDVSSVAFDQQKNKVILNLDGLGGTEMDYVIKVL